MMLYVVGSLTSLYNYVMRVEPFTVGSYVHVLKRGGRGMSITNDNKDRSRFLRLLYYCNDTYSNEWWERETLDLGMFARPHSWPAKDSLVEILCHTLLPNHFHLLLRETQKNGVSKFMQKVCGSMSRNFNEKYDQKGSIFQGSYKGKLVDSDQYLRYVAMYIMVKNVFELYPKGGLEAATKNFGLAWEWAVKYPFSSLSDYVLAENLGSQTSKKASIVTKGVLGEIWETPKEFKTFARDMIEGGKWKDFEFE